MYLLEYITDEDVRLRKGPTMLLRVPLFPAMAPDPRQPSVFVLGAQQHPSAEDRRVRGRPNRCCHLGRPRRWIAAATLSFLKRKSLTCLAWPCPFATTGRASVAWPAPRRRRSRFAPDGLVSLFVTDYREYAFLSGPLVGFPSGRACWDPAALGAGTDQLSAIFQVGARSRANAAFLRAAPDPCFPRPARPFAQRTWPCSSSSVVYEYHETWLADHRRGRLSRYEPGAKWWCSTPGSKQKGTHEAKAKQRGQASEAKGDRHECH